MDEDQARELGQKLRQRREQAGLTTRDLADLADTSHSTVVRLEQGFYEAPPPDKLSRIAEALGFSLADVYALADYSVPSDLPSFRPYLRTKYRDLPPAAVADLERSFHRVAKRHGVDLSGPSDGEDERPDPQPRAKKKGGSDDPTTNRKRSIKRARTRRP